MACVGCMGGGPARCKKCAPGYTLTGSKCLGRCTNTIIIFVSVAQRQSFSRVTRSYPVLYSDVDECSDMVLACHGLDEICTNTQGSFRCDCAPGFTRMDGICVRKQQPSESHTHAHKTHTHMHTQRQDRMSVSHLTSVGGSTNRKM